MDAKTGRIFLDFSARKVEQLSERIVACMEEPGTCDQVDTCTIRHSFESVQGMWLGLLNSLTLRRFTEIDGSQQAAGARP